MTSDPTGQPGSDLLLHGPRGDGLVDGPFQGAHQPGVAGESDFAGAGVDLLDQFVVQPDWNLLHADTVSELTSDISSDIIIGMTTEKHTHSASYQHSISSGWDLRSQPGDLGRAHGTCRCGVKVTRAIAEGESSATNYRPWVDYARFDAEMEAHEINEALAGAVTTANDPLALLHAQGVRDASGSDVSRTEGIRIHYGDAAANAYTDGLTEGLQANATGQRKISSSTRVGMKRGSQQAFPALHVVTGVPVWKSGMVATSECGLKCDVLEAVADDSKVQLCQRCRHSLGWDIEVTA